MTPVCWALTRSRVQLPAAPQTAARQAPLSVGFSSKNTGVGCHALLQGIFPTQGLTHVSCMGSYLGSPSGRLGAPQTDPKTRT